MTKLTIGVFGDRTFINQLGKKSTINDLALHHHSDSNHEFTLVAPNSEKIQSLLQALQMTEVPILVIKELNAQIGEEIVGISEMGFEKGFVVLDNYPEEQFRNVVKGTNIEKFQIIGKDVSAIFDALNNFSLERAGEPLVPIDNFFAVKSIGTVILGIVRRGEIKKYDKLMLEPLGRQVMIKSIQMQDKDFDKAEAGCRVGIALKGVEAEDLKRGYIICNKMDKTKKLGSITYNKFYKNRVKDGEQVIVSSGLQCVTGFVKGDIELEKEIAVQKPILIASTKQESLRIIGKANIS